MRPRLIACDLDGTLLSSDGSLAARTRDALARAQAAGALVVVCTARPVRWVTPLASALSANTLMICANGAALWDLATGAALETHELGSASAGELVARIEAGLPGGAWAVERLSGFAHEPGYVTRWPVPDGTPVAPVSSLIAEPALKLMFRHEQFLADPLLRRARGLIGRLAEISHSNSRDSLLEISAPGVSKASALQRLCERLGIAPCDVIAFGDMPNDLPMLRFAGHGVAVANAHPDVHAAADEVTLSNDDAGVAVVLERLYAAPAPRVRAISR